MSIANAPAHWRQRFDGWTILFLEVVEARPRRAPRASSSRSFEASDTLPFADDISGRRDIPPLQLQVRIDDDDTTGRRIKRDYFLDMSPHFSSPISSTYRHPRMT